VAFLEHLSADFVFEFSNGLVRQTSIHADLILTQGDPCLRQIWFLTEGTVQIVKQGSEMIQTVCDRDEPHDCFFCEDLFVEPGPYVIAEAPATVRAESHLVEAYHMGRTKLNAILRSNEEFAPDVFRFLTDIKGGKHSHLHRSNREEIFEDCLANRGAFELPEDSNALRRQNS
jgi:hypothetical protein